MRAGRSRAAAATGSWRSARSWAPRRSKRHGVAPDKPAKLAKGRRKSNGRDDEDDDSDASGREGRWQRVAIAAMKQSLRLHSMRLHQAITIQVGGRFLLMRSRSHSSIGARCSGLLQSQ